MTDHAEPLVDPRRIVAFDGDTVPTPDEIHAALIDRELELIAEGEGQVADEAK